MKRTRVFTLVMTIFWTVVAIVALVLFSRVQVGNAERVILVFLIFVMVVGNWLRYYRSR